MKIKELPENERPRERMLHYGVEYLSNIELLSIILKTGTKNLSVTDVATEIMKKIETIENIQMLTISSLLHIKGVGKTKAIELLSSIELGKRIFLNQHPLTKKSLKNPIEIYENTKYLFQGKKQECFYCLYFNQKQELIERKLLFIGTVNRSFVHPREIFKQAYLLSATSIICLHNHPSGDVHPSKEDIMLTDSLIQIGKLQHIPVVDHIIVSDKNYYSFYENNAIING